jgi:hypothetical protein
VAIPLISRQIKDPVNGTGESRGRHRDRVGGAVFDARDGSIALETSTSREIDTTKVSVAKHFWHSKVRKSNPGLSGSMTRNSIVSLHFEQRGLLILSANTCAPPYIGSCSMFAACRSMRTIGGALRESYVLNVTDVWKITDGCAAITEAFILKMKSMQYSPRAGTKSQPAV